jgi:hypothetical protein
MSTAHNARLILSNASLYNALCAEAILQGFAVLFENVTPSFKARTGAPEKLCCVALKQQHN